MEWGRIPVGKRDKRTEIPLQQVEAWQDPGDLTWSVDIAGPSATGGNALVAMLTWGPVVLGLVAVGGCSVANCGESPAVIAFDFAGFKELL
ncbi:hypothetical protein TURU_037853 [Turdus rufiventris]|nr:hypothetical protein TURU_037853 [Turdus rufiventris]